MKFRQIVLATTVAAATASTMASRAVTLETAPRNIISEAPVALASPPESDGAPGIITTGDTMSNMLPVALQPPDLPALEGAATDDLMALAPIRALPSWKATVAAGDTLDRLLSKADMEPQMRAEVALALAAEYDLRRLRPGHRLSVEFRPDGMPSVVTLAVDDGVQIEVSIDDTVVGRTVRPRASTVEHAGQLQVNESIYVSLDRAGVPAGFAVELARILGNSVDFRRDLRGGERLSILWGQAVLPNGAAIGQPLMSYAALDVGDDQFEIVWTDEDSGRATAYLNGEILRTVAPPVEGARLSSAFGQRRHPIYGNMRMHTGVDYAAASGTPIAATAPGRVSFIGWRSGYGQVVEIAHGSDTMTRYAHLSAVQEGLAVGNRVAAGETIGQVGETGTATAPNLHYEVRVGGRPIDPLGEELLASAEYIDAVDATEILDETRIRFVNALREDT